MRVVSQYVREQKRYTKNDLKSKFSFDEDGVEKFIKNLKAYGVLKSVKNTDDQLEMSDLVDDDIEITDETAESGDCLYVFTYVGVITCGSRVIKVYPKYLLSNRLLKFWSVTAVPKSRLLMCLMVMARIGVLIFLPSYCSSLMTIMNMVSTRIARTSLK